MSYVHESIDLLKRYLPRERRAIEHRNLLTVNVYFFSEETPPEAVMDL